MNIKNRIRTKLKLIGEKPDGIVDIKTNIEEKLLYHLFFLKNDKNQSVEVIEVEEINFTEVKKRLKGGESVFISSKSRQLLNKEQVAMEEIEENWYFPRV
jgi:hypothetical protein